MNHTRQSQEEQAFNMHVGKRLRRRRRLLGLSQQQVAEGIGLRFQQIQKYECGGTRIMPFVCHKLSKLLDVPIGHFFEGFVEAVPVAPAHDKPMPIDILSERETSDLVRAYYALPSESRAHLLMFIKTFSETKQPQATR